MLGIDIGVAAVKLALMRRQRCGWCLQACVVQPLPDDTVANGGLNCSAVRDTLITALTRLPARAREAAVAVASADAITRTIRLDDRLNDQDIENRIAIEAGQHLPFSLSEASMDFCRLPDTGDARLPGQDVLLVACRRDEVVKRVDLLQACDIRAVVVDVDALALSRFIGDTDPATAQIVLDLGAGGFRLHAFVQGRLLYSRNHQAGPAPTLLVQEIRRAIQLFLISTACEQEVIITLVGGLAAQPGLATGIATVCGSPVSLMPPPADLITHARVASTPWLASVPQLSLACALAMRAG